MDGNLQLLLSRIIEWDCCFKEVANLSAARHLGAVAMLLDVFEITVGTCSECACVGGAAAAP